MLLPKNVTTKRMYTITQRGTQSASSAHPAPTASRKTPTQNRTAGNPLQYPNPHACTPTVATRDPDNFKICHSKLCSHVHATVVLIFARLSGSTRVPPGAARNG